MKCFYCGKEAVGICKSCGRALCKDCCSSEYGIICKNSEICIEIDKNFEKTIEFNKKVITEYDGQINRDEEIINATGSLYDRYAKLYKIIGIILLITSAIPFLIKKYFMGILVIITSIVFLYFSKSYIDVSKKCKK